MLNQLLQFAWFAFLHKATVPYISYDCILLLKFKAAIFGHPPAEMCYQNNARDQSQSSPTSWSLLVHCPPTQNPEVGRWQGVQKVWLQSIGVNLLGTQMRGSGLPTAQVRATILQRTFHLHWGEEEPSGAVFLALVNSSRVFVCALFLSPVLNMTN